MNKSTISKKQILGFALMFIILIGMNFVPVGGDLTPEGRGAVGVLTAMLALLVTEALPIGVTCILAPALLVLFKCVPIGQAFSGFTNHIMFFVLASFGISAAITKVNLSRRLLIRLMKAFGKNVSFLLLAMIICAALISSIVSNVATTAVFMPIMLDFLNIYENPEDKKKTGRTFMLALPIASMIGGMMTPAGSSLNLLCIAQLENIAGLTVSFTQWMLFGIPLTLILLPFAWWVITKLNPPAEVDKPVIENYISTLHLPKKLGRDEILVAVLMTIMFTLWVLSARFPVFQVTVVAIIGFSIMLLPGIGVLNWKEFESSVSWSAYFLLGAVMSVGGAVVSTGASAWIAAAIIPASLNLPVFGVLFVVSLLIFALLIPIPVAPALIGILAAPLIYLANNTGISPIIMIMALGLCVANCYLLPLDTVPLITYMTGYYKMGELTKTAIPIQLLLGIAVALWLPVAALFAL